MATIWRKNDIKNNNGNCWWLGWWIEIGKN